MEHVIDIILIVHSLLYAVGAYLLVHTGEGRLVLV